MIAQAIVKALGGHWHGSYGTCRCPVHDDHEPSLSIRDGEGDDVVLKCHAGCDWRDIKDTLRQRGLLPEWCRGQDINCRRSATVRKAPPENGAKDEEARRKAGFARRLWHDARPITDTPAETYLRERGLKPGSEGWPETLRYHSGTKHGPTGLYLPCMIAAVTIWPSREVRAIHRTYIRADGRDKAPVTGNKRMLGPCAGGAIRLAQHGVELAISEGIETGLSVQQETGLSVWACGSAPFLQSVILPPNTKTVIIAADGDDPGEKAAQKAAKRFIAEGRTAKIARPPKGLDFNTLLNLPPNVAVISDQHRRSRARD